MPMSSSSNENLFSHKERVEIEVISSRLGWMFMKEYTVSVYIQKKKSLGYFRFMDLSKEEQILQLLKPIY